jgi:Tol biopolymer transport system component
VGKSGRRDIRIADIRGEDIGVLSDNPADDAAPRWSPDGRYVVFLSKRHGSWALWGVAVKKGLPDGHPFVIVAGMEDCSLLNWSPAGLAVNRQVTMFDIFTMQVDPTTARPLTKPKQLEYSPTGLNLAPIWSPDGGLMAFVCRRRDEGRAPYVVLMPRDGGHPREFKVPFEFHNPRWTPDGSALGFVAGDTLGKQTLFQLTLKSGTWEQWPTDIATWTTSEWSGDGGSYYFAIQGFGSSDPGIVRRAVSSDEKSYVYRPPKGKGTAFRHLRRSPDNKWLAFEEDSRRIIAVNLETGTSHTIIPQVEDTSKWIVKEGFGIPAWSSDSRHLLVVKTMTDDKTLKQHHELYVVGLFGGTSEKIDVSQSLPQDGRIATMDWSPDGKEVAFEVHSAVYETLLMRTVIPKEWR